MYSTCDRTQFYTSTTRNKPDYCWNIPMFPLKTNLLCKTTGKNLWKQLSSIPTLKDTSNPLRHNNVERIKSFCSHLIMDHRLASSIERRTHYLPIGWQQTRSTWHSYRKCTSYLLDVQANGVCSLVWRVFESWTLLLPCDNSTLPFATRLYKWLSGEHLCILPPYVCICSARVCKFVFVAV